MTIRVGCFCGWRSNRSEKEDGFGTCKLCGDDVHSVAYIQSYIQHTNGLNRVKENPHGTDRGVEEQKQD